jgi:hypothetical protein
MTVVPDGLDPHRSLGPQVAHWCETLLCMGPGDVQGDALVVDDEIHDFVVLAYALGLDGRRLVREAALSRLKGRAKSMWAGAVVCAEALGPVRFSHWADPGETSWWGYAYEPGEPVGRPVRAPFIRCLATEEGQAGNTYDNVKVMLTEGLIAEQFRQIDVADTRTFLPGGGEIRPSTAGAASKDGGRETFAVADEVHLYMLPVNRSMYATVSRNLTKRRTAEPWMLATTTMHDPGEQSVGQQLHELAEAIAEGRARNRSGLLYDHREGPEPADPDDDEQLRAAIAIAAGPAAAWMDLAAKVAEARSPTATWDSTLRYHLNRRRRSGQAAFDPDTWAARTVSGRLADRDHVVLGFDGSRFDDSTALVACRIGDGLVDLLGLWERPHQAPDGWQVPEHEVDTAVEDAFTRYDVWRLYADPPYWETAVARWAGRWGDKRVIEWFTHRERPMGHAVRSFAGAITTMALTHTGDADLARHIGNCRRRTSRVRDDAGERLWTVAKTTPDRKIDAAVAAVLAWEARTDAVAAGATPTSTRSRVLRTF